MKKMYVLVEVNEKLYLPLTAFLRFAKILKKEARKQMRGLSFNEIGVDLDKFHTSEISSESDAVISLRYPKAVEIE